MASRLSSLKSIIVFHMNLSLKLEKSSPQIFIYTGKTTDFYQKRWFSIGHESRSVDDLKFSILPQLSVEDPNLKSTFSWDLLQNSTLSI